MASGQRPGRALTKVCQIKLVLLGESAVGKTSLVLGFVKGVFDKLEFQEFNSTIGAAFLSKTVFIPNLGSANPATNTSRKLKQLQHSS